MKHQGKREEKAHEKQEVSPAAYAFGAERPITVGWQVLNLGRDQ